MNLRSVSDEIARKVDDFSAGASNCAEARAGVDELINADHTFVANGVMTVLEQEGFSNTSSGGEEDNDGLDD